MGRLSLFTSVLLVILGIVGALGGPGSRLDYFEAMAAKHERLRALGSPKLVVIGGSNASFGIDSEALERSTCRPVVNMAMHAGLGTRFMVNEVLDHLGDGDLLLVALEQPLYGAGDALHDAHYQAVDRYPEALWAIAPWHWPKVIGGVAVMRLRTAWRRWARLAWPPKPSIYHARGFNERGDFVHYDTAAGAMAWTGQSDTTASPILGKAFLRHAHRLVSQADKAGATVLFTWPVSARSTPAPDCDATISTVLRAEGLTMIGEPASYVLPDSAFLDTRYHVKAHGRSVRTAQLISDLCSSKPGLCCTQAP